MATRLITTDTQLRRYMPNVFATAQGETPLFDKVLPWLETAERWLFQQFIGNTFEPSLLAMGENEPVRLTATCVVAHEAMLRAVPSLDLVLTPNGFGIVSNQNVAPASRERVSRLIASLIALTGMVFLFLERVLSAVLVMASDGVKLGLTRYNNFTGQFAALRLHRTSVGELSGLALQCDYH